LTAPIRLQQLGLILQAAWGGGDECKVGRLLALPPRLFNAALLLLPRLGFERLRLFQLPLLPETQFLHAALLLAVVVFL